MVEIFDHFVVVVEENRKYSPNRVGSGLRRCPPTPPGILNRTKAVSINFYPFILEDKDCNPYWENQERFMAFPTACLFDICHQP